MRKRLYSFAIFILLLMLNSFAFAQSPQISTGLAWLYSTQTTTGNWPQVVSTDYFSTAATLDAIYSVDPANPAYSSAFQWLSTQIVSPTDYLSRQIIALQRAGQDTSGDVASLLLYQNSDGGFGGDVDCPNSYTLDTALALQALSAISYTNTTLIGQSLSYLTANQNTDGGWGFSSGEGSNTYVTSIVLRTLSAYNPVFINQNSINQASAYLLARQNTDGGFGDSPSTVYNTSLSLMSLIESGQGSVQAIQSGINYLTTSQFGDGSWNDDPYSTALALQALAEAKPNLAVSTSGITFSNSMPQSGATMTISAVISNTGYDNASNVIVRFYLGDPAVGGTQIGTDQIIPFMVPGSSAQASITTSFAGTGTKTIFVVVDPNNLISETSKTDNKASASVWIATLPDLAVYSEDLIPSTYVPTPGTAFTLSYTVRNLGESPVGAFAVSLYDGDPTQGGTLLQTANISGMNGSDLRAGTLGVTLTTTGNHALYLVADSGNQITELTKTNNTGTVTVNVGGTLSQADLAISPQDITLTPSRPHAGDTVTISANAHNIGAADANSFTVEFIDGAPEAGGTLIASQTISLTAGGTQTVTANWPIPSGIHDVYVVLDRMNAVIETNENNNRASVRVMTDMVDISLSATDLVFSPAHPVSGDTVALAITAHNTGIKDTGAFNLAVYNGDPNAGGVLLQTTPIGDIAGDGSVTLTYTFTASPQVYQFYAVADPENKVVELYKGNNTAIRSLTIKAPGQVLGPDLVPTKIDLADTTTDPQTLAISGTAHVTFQNIGDAKITTPFNVIIFEDKDGDGKYTAGVDNLLSTATNTQALWPEGAGIIDLPLSGTVTFLHSPLYAFVDSDDVILEQDETNNILVSCKDCQVVPTNPIQATVKWKFGQSCSFAEFWTPPTIMYLRDTNNDGKIDQNDIPDLVLNTENACNVGDNTTGRLWVFKGDTGQNYLNLYDPNHSPGSVSIPVSGDLDGDGKPEIIVPRIYGTSPVISYGYVVYNNDWTLKWDNASQVQAWNAAHNANPTTIDPLGTPVIADLDGDGKNEIIMGPTIVNADGSVRCVGLDRRVQSSAGNSYYHSEWQYSAIVADLDMDGKQEIIAGNTVYDSSCNIKWWNHSLTDGRTAIMNVDDDPYPDIVLIANWPVVGQPSGARLYLLDHNGNIKWGPVNIYQIYRGLNPTNPYPSLITSQPIVADFDGDGKPEIGITTNEKVLIFSKDGQLKNTLTFPYDAINGVNQYAEPMVFDLNGDGIPEVLINSQQYFTILSGKDGSTLFQDNFGGGIHYEQNVVIADVDGDGQVEAIVMGHVYKNAQEEMRVYHSADPNHPWTNGRRIWNEPSYHVTNVNDDGSIPQHEAPSWLTNSTYRTQAAIGRNPNPYLTPNLTASYMRIEQAGLSVNLAVRVGNGGAIASGPTVTVTFYDGNPAAGGTVIGTASTTQALNPGNFQDVVYSWAGGSLGLHHIYAVVDAANAITECRKDDNQVEADVTIAVEYPDLTISSQNIALPAGPYYAGTPIPVTATISNIGGLSASNVVVRLYNGNPASGGVQVGTDQVVPLINPGGSASVAFSFNTLGQAGTNVLYIVIDPANAIAEVTKANNTASIMLTVQQPELPDLAVSSTDIQLAPAAPQEGNTVTITATIHNQGAAVGNIPVSFYLGNPASGGVLIASQTSYPVLTFNTATTLQATLDTTGRAGQEQLYVVIDPANTITESNKGNDSATVSFLVQSAGLTSSLTLDKTAYLANDTVTATLTASNATSVTRTLSLNLYVKDTSGNLIATVVPADPVSIGPNGNTTVTRTWNTGKTMAGSYTMIAELSENGVIVSRTSPGFTITPDKRIAASVTTDKMQYGANDSAALTPVITSQSQNYIYQNLTALISLTDQNGNVLFTDRRSIANLMPGAAFTFKDTWSVGTNPPGTYTVTLTAQDSSGASIGTSSASFAVIGTSASGAGLTGAITAAPAAVSQNADEALSFTVTNNGNEAVASLTARVLIVNPDTGQVLQTYDNAASLPLGQTTAGSDTAVTGVILPRVYLAILQAVTPAMAQPKTLASATFTVLDGIPPVVTIVSPASKGIYNGTITLSALATDNFSGVNTVQFQMDSGAWTPMPLADPAQGLYASAWTPAPTDNSVHTINFMATDNAGNAGAPVGVSFTIDTRPPVLSLSTLPDGSYTNNATLNISGTATDNVAVKGVAIDNTAVTVNPDGTFSQAITLVTGTNIVTTVATDTAGNTTMDTRTITLDQTVPVITITNPADNSITNQSSSTVTGTVDKAATVSATVNGASPDPSLSLVSDAAFSFPISLVYGQNTIGVAATDLAGNIGTVKRTVTLDNQNPALSVTYPAEDMTTSQNQITVTGQVSDLTPVTVTVAVDGAVYTPAVVNGSFAQTMTFTTQKTYQINVTAVDEAGNQSLAQRNVIYNALPQNLGVFGNTAVSISGGYVDSYDSTQGAYSGVHGTNVTVGTNSTANGAINLSGGAVDYGDADVGAGGDTATGITTSGGALIDGTKGVLSMLKGMTPVSDPGGGTPATFANGTALATGTYRVSSINLSGGGIGTINGNVTLYVTGSLSLSGSSQLIILPGGSLTIYLDGSLTVSGGSIVNETLDPHNLTIYGTSTCTTATYSGSSAFYGVMYAPAAKTTVSGGNVYGSVVGGSVTISGGAAVHYDASLGNMGN